MKVDALAWSKFWKRHFFRDIQNSFHEVTHIGLEPHLFFLFKVSQQTQSLETSKVLAEMGRGWQAGWVMVKIFLSNLHRHVMENCWKFQKDILILVWFRNERLKICCNQWPPVANLYWNSALGGHWLQQIFSLSALNQTRIKISFWNFQHLFITCLR